MLEKFLKSIKREWELTILIVMVLVGFSGLVAGGIKTIGFWRGEEEPPAPRVNVAPKFSDKAFAYLKPTPAHQIGPNHAMKLQIPQDWLNKKRYEQMLAERERMRREADMKRKAEIDRMANMLANDKSNKKDPVEKVNEPNPPISHSIVFRGFMQSPKGEILAYLGREDAQAEVVKRAGSTFLRVGGQFKGYTVKEVTDDWVLLADPNGKDLTLIRGQRHEYDVTMNPDYLLEPEEPKTDDEAGSGETSTKATKRPKAGKVAGAGRNRTAGRSAQDMIQEYLKKNKGGPNQDMIKDFLKNNKGQIDQKTIQELMKKNRVKHEDVERLFR